MSDKKSILKYISITCAIHCGVLPFLVVLAPTMGSVLHNPVLELLLFMFCITCGVFVIYSGYCKHKKSHSVFLFGAGLLFWVAHVLLESTFGDLIKYVTLVMGTILVIGSYYFNHRFLNCCSDS